MVRDLGRTQDFYGGLFGWKFAQMAGSERLGHQVRAFLDGQEVAGIGQLPSGRRQSIAWTTYLATDDADATAAAIRGWGGTVGVGPLDAGEDGRLALVSDPAGATFGIRQARERSAVTAADGHGTPVRRELVTREPGWATAFYRSVFGYEVTRAGGRADGTVTLSLGGRAVATVHGVGEAPGPVRGSYWTTYFEVDDTDAAVRLVAGAGGHVIVPARETAAGRAATVADPEGAVFGVVRSAGR
ncbi:VOC family protein [Streptomyces sp. NBC_01498]|uniref:VOC family protein n=1 Tax=Streptomyces sp. NBC_01498 TaxID=2975870 RepID=UPI003FCC64C4